MSCAVLGTEQSIRMVSERIDSLAKELKMDGNHMQAMEDKLEERRQQSQKMPDLGRVSTQIVPKSDSMVSSPSIVSGSVDTETNIRRVDNSDTISQATFTDIRRVESSGSFVSTGTEIIRQRGFSNASRVSQQTDT